MQHLEAMSTPMYFAIIAPLLCVAPIAVAVFHFKSKREKEGMEQDVNKNNFIVTHTKSHAFMYQTIAVIGFCIGVANFVFAAMYGLVGYLAVGFVFTFSGIKGLSLAKRFKQKITVMHDTLCIHSEKTINFNDITKVEVEGVDSDDSVAVMNAYSGEDILFSVNSAYINFDALVQRMKEKNIKGIINNQPTSDPEGSHHD